MWTPFCNCAKQFCLSFVSQKRYILGIMCIEADLNQDHFSVTHIQHFFSLFFFYYPPCKTMDWTLLSFHLHSHLSSVHPRTKKENYFFLLSMSPYIKNFHQYHVGQDLYGKKSIFWYKKYMFILQRTCATLLMQYNISRYLNSVCYGSIGCKVFNGDKKQQVGSAYK